MPALCETLDVERVSRGLDGVCADSDRPDVPGVAVTLTESGTTVLERCCGMADLEHAVPITPATRFELASVSKSFTAFATILLAQEGRLGLDDDIRRYLPELPDYGAVVTVRHLLNQTSGLSEYLRLLPYMGLRDLDRIRLQDVMGMLAHQKAPDFPPGTRWAYSNTNYVVLAEIISRVTGRPFAEWMRERVFVPLEMLDTSIAADGSEILSGRAYGYSWRGTAPRRSIVGGSDMPGAAHVYSTIRDMAKWLENLRTGKLGGRDLIDEMQRKGVLASGDETWYAAGLGIGEHRGVQTIGHSGQTGAFRSELLYCPHLEVGVVVLANDARKRPDRIARTVLDLYLGDRLAPAPVPVEAEGREPRPFVAVEPPALARFVGSYRLEADPSVLVAVAREGDRLAAILAGVGMDYFQPVAPGEFENALRNTRLTFVDGPDGRPSRVKITLKGEEMWAGHVSFEGQPPPDELVGTYYSEEWGTVYEVVRDGEDFLIRHRWMGDRPLQRIEPDRLAGGFGLLTFVRDGDGAVSGFDFEEPEDLPGRKVGFRKIPSR